MRSLITLLTSITILTFSASVALASNAAPEGSTHVTPRQPHRFATVTGQIAVDVKGPTTPPIKEHPERLSTMDIHRVSPELATRPLPHRPIGIRPLSSGLASSGSLGNNLMRYFFPWRNQR